MRGGRRRRWRLLVVWGAKGEVLIPFAESYLRKIDIEGGRIEMEWPEGLVELSLGLCFPKSQKRDMGHPAAVASLHWFALTCDAMP